ncbi:hypothetical protein L7F22_065015 [Adiantum nelumboides]|nr:hypothetical protein [Adiantum nelumboides]
MKARSFLVDGWQSAEKVWCDRDQAKKLTQEMKAIKACLSGFKRLQDEVLQQSTYAVPNQIAVVKRFLNKRCRVTAIMKAKFRIGGFKIEGEFLKRHAATYPNQNKNVALMKWFYHKQAKVVLMIDAMEEYLQGVFNAIDKMQMGVVAVCLHRF